MGLVFVGTSLTLFLFSMFFAHSLAYAAAFLFFSVLLLSLFATNGNMGGVALDPATRRRQHRYGDDQRWTVLVANGGPGTARTVSLGDRGMEVEAPVDVPPAGSRALVARTRLPPGRHRRERLRPRSAFPFGLFGAWRVEPAGLSLFVAPRRSNGTALGLEDFRLPPSGGAGEASLQGGDEFAGLRRYAEGDPVGRIDWKRSLPGRILTRSYGERAAEAHLIDGDLARARGAGPVEALEAVSHFVHACERGGGPYAVRLGGETGPFGRGRAHWEAVMERLASAAESAAESA